VKETSKAFRRRIKDPFWDDVFVGRGLDIGSGGDPLKGNWWGKVVSVDTFDRKDGDAQDILRYLLEKKGYYDFVHSSNCLEHMADPEKAIIQWFDLVRPGGHLVITVPDEDLYEQGVWPSRWNKGHRHSFTIWKRSSWNREASINIVELLPGLAGHVIRRLQIADSGYDRTRTGVDQTMPRDGAEAFIELVVQKLAPSA
jgi:SAM-dependent methyltransferase